MKTAMTESEARELAARLWRSGISRTALETLLEKNHVSKASVARLLNQYDACAFEPEMSGGTQEVAETKLARPILETVLLGIIAEGTHNTVHLMNRLVAEGHDADGLSAILRDLKSARLIVQDRKSKVWTLTATGVVEASHEMPKRKKEKVPVKKQSKLSVAADTAKAELAPMLAGLADGAVKVTPESKKAVAKALKEQKSLKASAAKSKTDVKAERKPKTPAQQAVQDEFEEKRAEAYTAFQSENKRKPRKAERKAINKAIWAKMMDAQQKKAGKGKPAAKAAPKSTKAAKPTKAAKKEKAVEAEPKQAVA